MAIAYRPEFLAPLNFDTCAVLYLSQLYWLAKERFKGTFYQSKEQLKEQTGLNRYRQDKCRNAVIKAGFVSVETRYEGTHRRTYFKVDVERLDRLIGKIKDVQKSLNKEQVEKEVKATKAGNALQYRNNAKPVTMGYFCPSPDMV